MIKSILILFVICGAIFADEIILDEDLLNSFKKMNQSRCMAFEMTKGETVTKLNIRTSKANGGMFYFNIFYDDYKVYAAITQNNLRSSKPSLRILKFTYRETREEMDYYASMFETNFIIFGLGHLPDNTIYATLMATAKNGDLRETKYFCRNK